MINYEKFPIQNLHSINRNENGDYYFLYLFEAPRSINPKTKRHEQELIAVGVPKNKLNNYLRGYIESEAKKICQSNK